MKKLVFVFAAFAAVSFASCNDGKTTEPTTNGGDTTATTIDSAKVDTLNDTLKVDTVNA